MPSGQSGTPTKTWQGFTKSHFLTDDDVSEFLDAVRGGMPVEYAARAVGTSALQMKKRVNKDPDLQAQFEEAREEGHGNLQELLRHEWFYQAFTEKNWKALELAIRVHLPEAEALNKHRYEHTVGPTDALMAAAEKFANLSLEQIREMRQLAEAEQDNGLPLIEQ